VPIIARSSISDVAAVVATAYEVARRRQ